jgi:hypothetical protein
VEKPVDYDEIRAAESCDPIRYVADESGAVSAPGSVAGEVLLAGGSLLEQDAITKMNAGALLTFAVWSLPKDVVAELFRNAPSAFTQAYGAACEAYGIGGR